MAWVARLDRTARLYCEAPPFSEEIRFILGVVRKIVSLERSVHNNHPLAEDLHTFVSSVAKSKSPTFGQPDDNTTLTRLLRISYDLRDRPLPFDIKFSVHAGEAV
jgi:hypothetical protein